MQTHRDAQIVDWIGRLGAAGAEHVMSRFGMGRSWAYQRLAGLQRDGLLDQRIVLYRQPGLYLATAAGLRWQGLEYLDVYPLRPGGFEHAWEVAGVAVATQFAFSRWRVLSERELRAEEAQCGRLIASAKTGERPGGRPALHRPDLALISHDGQAVAVEVELSVKAPRRRSRSGYRSTERS